MRSSIASALFLLALSLGGCSLPAPYETYPPSTPPAPPPRSPNALTSAGPITTTPDNEMDFGAQPTTTAPAQSTPADKTPAESSKGRQVAICYNRFWNSASAVHSAAQQACGSKTAPRIISQDTDLDACPVLTPSHAVYACGAP